MTKQVVAGRVIAGVDGSEASRRALRWAADHAARHGVGLDIVHAWSVPYFSYGAGASEETEAAATAARELVDEEEGWLIAQGAAPADRRVLLDEGDPASSLVSRSEGAEILVVGSRGRGRLAGLVLGSVSQRCIDHAVCPVAVVPPDSSEGTRGRVIVGIDGSDAAARALRWAYEEAARRRVHLEVVHAFDFVTVVSPFGPTVAVERDELEKAAHELLEDAVATVAANCDVRPRSVRLRASGNAAAAALLEQADDADLLVVGSRGRGAFRTVLAGSVAQQCARRSPCPVVVVRSQPHA
jgi:nucleotide-binding universal stress UspA family protein